MTINITSLNANKKEMKGEYFSNYTSNEALLSFFTFSFTTMTQVTYSISIEYLLLGN